MNWNRRQRGSREHVSPAVVRIGRGAGRGGGFVVADGAVVTNAHNVRGNEVTVTFADGRSDVGSVSGVDVDGDLAVIRVDTGDAPTVTWNAGEVTQGAAVFAVTTPVDAGSRVTFGTVSAIGRAFRGPRGRLISGGVEHTAPLARGSSGSPVVDAAGHLVGINTHRLGEGFYLAVPADPDLRVRVDALVRGESPRRVYLGLALAPAAAARRLRASVGLPARDGLLVRGVDADSPAARSGIRVGDLIVEAEGSAVASPDDLFAVLAGVGDGGALTVRLLRGADEVEVRVGFGETSEQGSA